MKLTAQIKLHLSPAQTDALKRTLETANAACNAISQACNQCGYTDKRNRPDQAHFRCGSCGHAAAADVNAACNIRDRAAVNQPMVADLRV